MHVLFCFKRWHIAPWSSSASFFGGQIILSGLFALMQCLLFLQVVYDLEQCLNSSFLTPRLWVSCWIPGLSCFSLSGGLCWCPPFQQTFNLIVKVFSRLFVWAWVVRGCSETWWRSLICFWRAFLSLEGIIVLEGLSVGKAFHCCCWASGSPGGGSCWLGRGTQNPQGWLFALGNSISLPVQKPFSVVYKNLLSLINAVYLSFLASTRRKDYCILYILYIKTSKQEVVSVHLTKYSSAFPSLFLPSSAVLSSSFIPPW